MRISTATAALALLAGSAFAADVALPGGHAFIPQSSIPRPEDRGHRAHTNVQIFVPDGGLPMTAANTPGGFFETPASLACVYRQTTYVAGCSPAVVTAISTRGKRVIAVVDAYDNPNAQADLSQFAREFGLPAPSKSNFEVVYAARGSSTPTTKAPPVDSSGGWEIEESLDVQMAHAMAPRAKVILVEAYSSSFSDLFPAVTLASNLVAAAGGGEVSMSWGTGDFSGETSYDSYFSSPGVVYFASAGDSAGVSYPSSSPYVVSAGGTTINRNAATGDYVAESAWGYTGGGATPNEPTPSYQSALASTLNGDRGTPDMAFNADVRTGNWIYDSYPLDGSAGTWYIVGGTSAAAPGLAGLVNAAGGFALNTNAELTLAYASLGTGKNFHDITLGNCGYYAGNLAAHGWDFCTGLGSISGFAGK